MTGRIGWQALRVFRYDLLAVLAIAAIMAVAVDFVPLQAVSGVVPLLGIVVSIFIGFRNRNAYATWWEARTLWSGIVSNGRSLDYALTAYEDGSPELAAVTDRMRRREARHAWTLAAELRDHPAPPGLADLTPEDPPDATATELLNHQATDIGKLGRAGLIDRQARRVLVTINSTQVGAASSLERIRRQPLPRFYGIFVRGLAWFFAIIVCTRLGGDGHDNPVGIVLGILIMTLFVVAERLGRLLEQPLSDSVFSLPLDRFCTELTVDLLGREQSGSREEETKVLFPYSTESEGRP